MDNLFQFVPKHKLEVQKNVDEFIRRCRDDLTVFGNDLDWDNWKWKGVVNFTKVGVSSRGAKPQDVIDENLLPFAKAYVRYQQGYNPTKTIQEIKAIRCIEPALIKVKGIADITLLDITVLDESAVVIRENYGPSGYHAGAHIEKLAKFLSDNRMIQKPISWKNPITRYKDRNRVGVKGKERRAKKLPKDYQLEYMAEMFANNLQDPRDKFTTSMFALGMCAPGRVSEFHDLSSDCLHEEKDRNGVVRTGFRFYAGKGFGADIKWVSTPFVSIAKDAIERLKQLSHEGRKLAKWYEDTKSGFYRHERCPDVGEQDPLTPIQICDAMGWSAPNKSKVKSVAFNPSKKWILKIRDENGCITLQDLDKYVRSKLPKGWPWKNKERGVKYSDCILCFRKDELHGNRGVSPVLLWVPNNSQFTFDLGPRNTKNHKSIWVRHGYTNPDGSEIKLTSHQLRHLLNTVAQRGDLGQLDIAMWSGRSDIHQNRVYNHMSEYEIIDKVKKTKSLSRIMGPLDKVKNHMPVTLKDLDAIGEGIAHITEFGYCVHDFAMIPCQKHLDCINCTEQVCIKGDDEKLTRLKQQRDSTRLQLEKAEKGIEDGIYGADRWYIHQKKTVQRADELIELLESSTIQDGAVIRLKNESEYSALKREQSAISSAIPSDVKEIQNLMGKDFG